MTTTQPAPAPPSDQTSARPPVLRAAGVGVELGGRRILHGADLDLHPGEVLALVGPNGAGKSTLLGVLSGDIAPDDGTVELDGEDLARQSAAHLAKRRAVQLQEARVSFAFTAVEVVRMGRAPWHGTEHIERDEAVVAEAMRAVETSHLAERKFPTLSGGEKARTAFARVLAQETAVLLLDEPSAALDIRHSEALLRLVRERAAAGAAVVVVLHDLSVAAAHADRVVLVDGGRIRADGTPRDVLTPELLEDVYRHPVTVIDHPSGLVIVPDRRPSTEEQS